MYRELYWGLQLEAIWALGIDLQDPLCRLAQRNCNISEGPANHQLKLDNITLLNKHNTSISFMGYWHAAAVKDFQ